MSSSLLDRFSSSRNRSPILPLHASPRRPPSEYTLDELDPRPYDGLEEEDEEEDEEVPQPRQRRPVAVEKLHQESPAPWSDRGSSVGSSSKRKPRPMFAGPPPPIASSIIISNTSSRSNSNHRASGTSRRGPVEASRQTFSSLLLNSTQPRAYQHPDSIWRGLKRQEKAIERDIQELLDIQAAGLVAGSGSFGGRTNGSEIDGYSDMGGSTPTGTFYSTATSKSRMVNSLYTPPRSTPEGNVIPVRQPTSHRPRGLRASRTGLRKAMIALVNLKQEEDAHIDAELSQRKKALIQLERLATKRSGVQAELETLEHDEEEPMGKELRELGTRYDTIDQEIHILEKKLVGMRNQRRWLREKISDVKNRREAGLSGYWGALKEVESEVTTYMHHPPIQPLDPEFLNSQGPSGIDSGSAGGEEFLRLVPERRTIEMAKSWWQNEITILEQRKSQISSDQEALEEGGAVWNEVSALVADYEQSLRSVMRGGTDSEASTKGKEKAPSQEELIRQQLSRMDQVVAELEEHMQLAENKNWNLLICAIGAELEAFKEAHTMLKSIAGPEGGQELQDADAGRDVNNIVDDQFGHDDAPEHDSDNEVPPDLLVSHLDNVDDRTDQQQVPDQGTYVSLQSRVSEDEVPPEFLDQHDHVKLPS